MFVTLTIYNKDNVQESVFICINIDHILYYTWDKDAKATKIILNNKLSVHVKEKPIDVHEKIEELVLARSLGGKSWR